MTVIFRDCPGFPNYRVGDDGSVWTLLARSGGRPDLQGRPTDTWRRIHSHPVGDGTYLGVNLTRNGVQHARKIHRLVLEAFVGPRPDGLECCHQNGHALDNRLANLRWDTRKANVADRQRHQMARAPQQKLSDASVAEMRARAAGKDGEPGESYESLAEAYGVSASLVSYIVRRIRRVAVA